MEKSTELFQSSLGHKKKDFLYPNYKSTHLSTEQSLTKVIFCLMYFLFSSFIEPFSATKVKTYYKLTLAQYQSSFQSPLQKVRERDKKKWKSMQLAHCTIMCECFRQSSFCKDCLGSKIAFRAAINADPLGIYFLKSGTKSVEHVINGPILSTEASTVIKY